jgi:uncharacterized membrane protein (UPF0127 family)
MKQGVIFIGDNLFEAYLAVTAEEQMYGLMYVPPPAPNMAFLYERPQYNRFWMKNTEASLDIIFCNDGKVSEICYGEPYSLRTIGGNEPSNLVIELPYGSVESSRILIGQSAGIVTPAADELRKIFAAKY